MIKTSPSNYQQVGIRQFKDAVKLICSNDKQAMHNVETLEALRKIHPTGATD